MKCVYSWCIKFKESRNSIVYMLVRFRLIMNPPHSVGQFMLLVFNGEITYTQK